MIKPIPKLKLAFGRDLRNNPTVWESKLWQHLKNKNLGVRFKRQTYIGGYLVDFCCAQKKLIIELYGSPHKSQSNRGYDETRLNFLKREGYKILIFWNSEIDRDMNKVLEKVVEAIN